MCELMCAAVRAAERCNVFFAIEKQNAPWNEYIFFSRRIRVRAEDREDGKLKSA